MPALAAKVSKEGGTMWPCERPSEASRNLWSCGVFSCVLSPSSQVEMNFKPIRIVHKGREENAAIASARRIESTDEAHQEMIRSHQMLQHTPSLTMLFTCEGKSLQSNVGAKSYYLGYDATTTGGVGYHVKEGPIDLIIVLESIEWAQDEAVC